MLGADGLPQIRHLHRGECRFETFVAHLQASAVDGLFQRFAGEDAESVRDTGFLGGLSDAASDFIDDDIVVGGVSAEQATEADDGIIFFAFGESTGGGWDFESAGDADDDDVLVLGARAKQAVKGAA